RVGLVADLEVTILHSADNLYAGFGQVVDIPDGLAPASAGEPIRVVGDDGLEVVFLPGIGQHASEPRPGEFALPAGNALVLVPAYDVEAIPGQLQHFFLLL